MDLKKILHQILAGNKGVKVPPSVLQAFDKRFNHPLNVEWIRSSQHFEAVFYQEELEQIACYSHAGELLNLKINLHLNALPLPVSNRAHAEGELMNAIAIHEKNGVRYELIVRDQTLNRYFMLVSSSGEVLEKEIL
ncbi:MAG: hypothetical protein AB7D05_06955 [Mangrovibacterium sp.]